MTDIGRSSDPLQFRFPTIQLSTSSWRRRPSLNIKVRLPLDESRIYFNIIVNMIVDLQIRAFFAIPIGWKVDRMACKEILAQGGFWIIVSFCIAWVEAPSCWRDKVSQAIRIHIQLPEQATLDYNTLWLVMMAHFSCWRTRWTCNSWASNSRDNSNNLSSCRL